MRMTIQNVMNCHLYRKPWLIGLFAILCFSGCRTYPRIGVYDVILEDKSLDWCTIRFMRTYRGEKGVRIEVETEEGVIVQTDVVDEGWLINSTLRYLSPEAVECMNVIIHHDGKWKVVRAIIGENGLLEVLYDDTETDSGYSAEDKENGE